MGRPHFMCESGNNRCFRFDPLIHLGSSFPKGEKLQKARQAKCRGCPLGSVRHAPAGAHQGRRPKAHSRPLPSVGAQPTPHFQVRPSLSVCEARRVLSLIHTSHVSEPLALWGFVTAAGGNTHGLGLDPGLGVVHTPPPPWAQQEGTSLNGLLDRFQF